MLSKIAPEAGKILISEPFMLDPNFRRAVVFMVEHGVEGTVGFVLNQETEVTINDIIPQFPLFDSRLHIGGPVQLDNMHFIHRLGKMIPGSVQICEGVFWGGDFEVLKKLIDEGKINLSDVRFFLGYSGWDPGQLENELNGNSWIVSDIVPDQLFSEDYENFWKSSVKNLGSKFAHIANFPENPNWN